MADVFISYRRSDSEYFSGALLRELNSRLSEHEIYMDYEDICPGEKFAESIMKAVSQCHAVIVVIGKDWLSVSDNAGRRLDDPNDWVRKEIVAALQGEALVIPLILEGARMPKRSELPEEIEELASIQAISVSNANWDTDIRSVCEVCSTKLGLKRIVLESQELVFKHIGSFEASPGYRCSSCKSDFVNLNDSIAVNCPLCKSEILIQADEDISRPTRIERALAKISLDEARDLLICRLGRSMFRSLLWRRMLREEIDLNIVYFPFFKFDCCANSVYKARRTDKSHSEGASETNTWYLEDEHQLRIEGIYIPASEYQWWIADLAPIDATYEISLALSDSSEPQNCFNLAVTRNIEECSKLFAEKAKEDISDSIKVTIGGDEQNITSLRTSYSKAKLSIVEVPIYISCHEYRGVPSIVAINSANLKIFDNGPGSLLKHLLVLFGWVILSILIGLAIVVALSVAGLGLIA